MSSKILDSIKEHLKLPAIVAPMFLVSFSGDMHAGSKAWKTVWRAGQGVGTVKDPETIKEV